MPHRLQIIARRLVVLTGTLLIMVASSTFIVCSFKCTRCIRETATAVPAVSSSQNCLQFARIDDQDNLDKNLTQSERATTFVQIVQSCTAERWFLTLNDLLTHEVGRRAKNRPYILSKMIVISAGTYSRSAIRIGSLGTRRVWLFIYPAQPPFVRILRHFANGIAGERGYGWTDWKSLLGMRSGTYLNPV